MRTIKVVAAVIRRDNFILATQRGYGPYKDRWEFPGGKVEKGESPHEALKREIHEELNIEIEVNDYICTVEYDYSEFHLNMECYWAAIIGGRLELKEHEASKWLDASDLLALDWLPADQLVVKGITMNNDKMTSQ